MITEGWQHQFMTNRHQIEHGPTLKRVQDQSHKVPSEEEWEHMSHQTTIRRTAQFGHRIVAQHL